MLPLLFYVGTQRIQHFVQILVLNRLQQITGGINLNGFLGIAEILMAADEYNFDLRIDILSPARKLRSSHNGHAYVGQDEIYPYLLHDLKRIESAICSTHYYNI
ncbi:hypothetical protein D3C75_828190 [compost metagenome]